MKKIFAAAILSAAFQLIFFSFSNAQLTEPADGGRYVMVGERIGITDVTIDYDRPGVKRKRRKIWGNLILLAIIFWFGNSKQAHGVPVRMKIQSLVFQIDVKVEGHDLPAGKYGFLLLIRS